MVQNWQKKPSVKRNISFRPDFIFVITIIYIIISNG
jgi:hypothetical protein